MSLKGYYEAMRDVLDEEMTRDERIMLLGDEKVWDFAADDARLPALPEMDYGYVELALGVALSGMKPVVDLRGARRALCALRMLEELRSTGSAVILAREAMVSRAMLPQGAAVYRLNDVETAARKFRAALRGEGVSVCLESDAALRAPAEELPDGDQSLLPADEEMTEEAAHAERTEEPTAGGSTEAGVCVERAGADAPLPDCGLLESADADGTASPGGTYDSQIADCPLAGARPCEAEPIDGLGAPSRAIPSLAFFREVIDMTELLRLGAQAGADAEQIARRILRRCVQKATAGAYAFVWSEAEECLLAPHPSQAAILCAGRVHERVAMMGGCAQARPSVCLGAGADVDALSMEAVAGLLNEIKRLAEHPALLLIENESVED